MVELVLLWTDSGIPHRAYHNMVEQVSKGIQDVFSWVAVSRPSAVWLVVRFYHIDKLNLRSSRLSIACLFLHNCSIGCEDILGVPGGNTGALHRELCTHCRYLRTPTETNKLHKLQLNSFSFLFSWKSFVCVFLLFNYNVIQPWRIDACRVGISKILLISVPLILLINWIFCLPAQISSQLR